MILLDSQCHELGEIESDLDVEIGTTEDSTNDFQFTNNRLFSKNTAGFYIPGTEIGGLIEYSNISLKFDGIIPSVVSLIIFLSVSNISCHSSSFIVLSFISEYIYFFLFLS